MLWKAFDDAVGGVVERKWYSPIPGDPENALVPILVTVLGMVTLVIAGQTEKA